MNHIRKSPTRHNMEPKSASRDMKEKQSQRRASFEADALPHLNALWRTALWLTMRGSAAEELVLKTMTRAYVEWQGHSDLIGSKARLFRTLTREFFGFGRQKQKQQQSPPFHSEHLTTTAGFERRNPPATIAASGHSQLPPLAGISHVAVKGAIARLRPHSRLMLILLFRERCSYADIAYITDLRENSVKTILTRLRCFIPHHLTELAELEVGNTKWSDQSVRFENKSKTVPVPSDPRWKIQGDGGSQ